MSRTKTKKNGETQLEQAGHQVTEPDVAASREQLAGLMTAFDNIGVSIVEEQWRKLTDNERSVSASWANDMRIGKERPCPDCLLPFANDALKEKAKKHGKTQAAAKRLLVRCRFLKPSAVLPTGDEGEDAIKWSLAIPESDIARPSIPKEFFVGKRLGIEISLRGVDKWDDLLPGMTDDLPEIIQCESDVKGFTETMTAYKFGFKMSTDLIDDNTALREYAKREGSVRLTLLGDIPKKSKAEKSTAETMAKARPLPGQKSLLDTSPSNGKVSTTPIDKDGCFTSPDEYQVPSSSKEYGTTITIGELDGKFFPSADTVFVDAGGVEHRETWGPPKNGLDPCASLTLAVQKMIGTVIQFQMENSAKDKCIADLRKHLKDLEAGGSPVPMPE